MRISEIISESVEQDVAEGLSKRDKQDVAAIKAAIARLEAQLNHPNADKAAIQQSIEHERKRLALYGQDVATNELGEARKRKTKQKSSSRRYYGAWGFGDSAGEGGGE